MSRITLALLVVAVLLGLAAPATAEDGCQETILPATANNEAGTVQFCASPAPAVAAVGGAWDLVAYLHAPQLLGAPSADALMVEATASGCSLGAPTEARVPPDAATGGSVAVSWRVTMTRLDCDVRLQASVTNGDELFAAFRAEHASVEDATVAQWLPGVILGFVAAFFSWRLLKSGLLLYLWVIVPACLGMFGLFIPALALWVYTGTMVFAAGSVLLILFAHRFGIRADSLFPDPQRPRL